LLLLKAADEERFSSIREKGRYFIATREEGGGWRVARRGRAEGGPQGQQGQHWGSHKLACFLGVEHCPWSPPFRQSPLQTLVVVCSLLSVLCVPFHPGPAKRSLCLRSGFRCDVVACATPVTPFFFLLLLLLLISSHIVLCLAPRVG
jgi:hypothetical protein